jgi:hypothetical protein
MHLTLSVFECDVVQNRIRYLTLHAAVENRGVDSAGEKFKFIVQFFVCKAKLADGSLQDLEKGTVVILDIDLGEFDPQELQSMGEKAVKNVVEKLGHSVLWGPAQEVALLKWQDGKEAYVRIENGEDLVEAIHEQNGWTSHEVTFKAKLVELNSISKVGYVPSQLATQMIEDDWAAQRVTMPIRTEVTVLAEGPDADAGVVSVDWNLVQLAEQNDLVIAPMSDTEMAKLFRIPVHDKDKEESEDRSKSDTADGNIRSLEDVDKYLMEEAADFVDDAHDDELVTLYDKENPVICFQACESLDCVSRLTQSRRSLTRRPYGLIKRSSMRGAEVMMALAPFNVGGTFLLDASLMEVPSGLIKSQMSILALLLHRR